MCGIVGIYNFNGESPAPEDVKKMCRLITRRGPDDEGILVRDGAGLGSRRLSIIDLSPAGHQPMANETGDLWVVYNGEIYNFPELTNELKKAGHVFRSQTDTEVILHGYEEWREKMLEKFNGMWSFALYDAEKRELFCGRDQFGIKPFYYYLDGEKFIFSSEIKPLLQFVKAEPNYGVIFDYLVYGITDHTEETFFKNIRSLLPGHYLKVNRRGVEKIKYWRPDFTPLGSKPETAAEELNHLLKDSVRIRLRSDVPVGVCLSGGIDSSAIASFINILLKEKLSPLEVKEIQKTFSARYRSSEFDEGAFINEIVKNTPLQPHFVFLTGENLKTDLREFVRAQEEPVPSTSMYAQYKVFQLVRSAGVKVTLDGQGADELFCGYPRYSADLFFHYFKGLHWLRLAKEVYWSNRTFPKNFRNNVLKAAGYFLPEALRFKTRGLVSAGAGRWLNPSFSEEILRKRPSAKYLEAEKLPDAGFFNQQVFEVFNRTQLPQLLRFGDRNSMNFSVEARLPFLDQRLVDFAFRMPPDWKIKNGLTKYLLRQSLKDTIPPKIRDRKDKIGFATPETGWLKTDLKESTLEILAASPRLKEFFDPGKIRRDLAGYYENKINLESTAVWRLINLAVWMDIYI